MGQQWRTLTNSALTTFLLCARKYDLAYNMRCKPLTPSPALRIGSLVHSWVEGVAPLMGPATEDDDDACIACAVAWGYQLHYESTPHQSWPFVEHEQFLKAPLCNPYTHLPCDDFDRAGKTDGLLQYKSGPQLYEFKTTGLPLTKVAYDLRYGTQLPTYGSMWGQLSPGRKLRGYMIEVVKKPQLKRKDGESALDYVRRLSGHMLKKPEEFFLRTHIPWSADRIEQIDRLYWRIAQAIRHCDRLGYPPALGPQCSSIFGGCEYRRLCWHHDSTGYRIAATPHEELYGGPHVS